MLGGGGARGQRRKAHGPRCSTESGTQKKSPCLAEVEHAAKGRKHTASAAKGKRHTEKSACLAEVERAAKGGKHTASAAKGKRHTEKSPCLAEVERAAKGGKRTASAAQLKAAHRKKALAWRRWSARPKAESTRPRMGEGASQARWRTASGGRLASQEGFGAAFALAPPHTLARPVFSSVCRRPRRRGEAYTFGKG